MKIEAQSMLPDISDFELLGEELKSGQNCQKWQKVQKVEESWGTPTKQAFCSRILFLDEPWGRTSKHFVSQIGEKVNKYTIWVRMASETAVPVHYEMKVHYEIYIINMRFTMRWRASTRWWGATTITTSSPIKTSVRRSLLTKVSASLCILCCVAVVQSTFYLLSDVLNSNISLLILSSVWPVSEQELPRLAGARACLWPCLHHEPGKGVCSKSRSSCQVRIMLTIF